MAISSVLNPQNIIGNRKGTAEKFQNFMTGGNSSLGSSIVNSTSSNKIVPFERAGVRPITPDFNSIVSTISTKTDTALNTNIKNQDNSILQFIYNTINGIRTRSSKIDDILFIQNTPSNSTIAMYFFSTLLSSYSGITHNYSSSSSSISRH